MTRDGGRRGGMPRDGGRRGTAPSRRGPVSGTHFVQHLEDNAEGQG